MGKIFSNKSKKKNSFSLLELVVILGIVIILVAIAIPAFRVFQRSSDLGSEAEKIINILRLAQNKTVSSERAGQYGVYFSTSTDPNRYILFKGGNYASRAVSFDEIRNLSKAVEIYETDLWGGNEVVFERITGYASSSSSFGRVSIRLKTSVAETKTIYIENSGLVDVAISASSSDSGRLTDSRHIHFDYNRIISTSTEKIILDFSTVSQQIIIADNLENGQIFWEGEISVDGSFQKIKIHTHRLNSPDTQFSIHRDGRYNDKALSVSIDGDNSGTLISYASNGQEARGTSVNLTTGEGGDPKRQ